LLADASAAHELVAPHAQTPEKWLASLQDAPEVFVGTGAFAHRDMLRAACPGAMIVEGAAMYPSTLHLAQIAHAMPPLSERDVRSLEPVYVRESGAEQVRLRAIARAPKGLDG
jgi:hypothetical protein